MGEVTERLRQKLENAFSPERLEVVDDSDKHQGHAGHREGGESHFTVIIVSQAFAGMGRVDRQRQVNRALAEELAGPVHALSIKALAPEEMTRELIAELKKLPAPGEIEERDTEEIPERPGM